jgi:transposase
VPTEYHTAIWDRHLNALWYILVNGNAWRALPSEFGKWGTIFQFFNRLSLDGFFEFLQQKMITGNDSEAVFFDSTHAKVHQHAYGAGSIEDEDIGTSRGGRNTKLHMVVDILGRLAAPIILTPANESDTATAPELVAEVKDVAAVGDKGYDSKKFRKQLREQGCEPCIPCRSNVKIPEPYDKILYRSRHCVENVFQKIKVYRRVNTRFEKTSRNYFSFVILSLSAVYESFELW